MKKEDKKDVLVDECTNGLPITIGVPDESGDLKAVTNPKLKETIELGKKMQADERSHQSEEDRARGEAIVTNIIDTVSTELLGEEPEEKWPPKMDTDTTVKGDPPTTEEAKINKEFAIKRISGELDLSDEPPECKCGGECTSHNTLAEAVGMKPGDFDKLDHYDELVKENGKLKEEKTRSDLWQADKRGFMDRALGKFASRKLLAFAVTTIAFFMGLLVSQYYMAIVMCYIGSQTAVDIFNRVKLPSVTDAAWESLSRRNNTVPQKQSVESKPTLKNKTFN